MAEKVSVIALDDLDGSKIETYEGPVQFATDGWVYEIDLTDANHESLRDALARYVAAARKVGKLSKVHRAAPKAPNMNAAERKMRAEIREWVKKQGGSLVIDGETVTVGDRGRVPSAVVDLYLKEMAEQVTAQAGQAATEEPARTPAFSG